MGLISKVGKNNIGVKEQELKLKKHNKHQISCMCFYHIWKAKSIQSNENILFIVCDKMDHLKTAFLKLEVKKKMISSLG
jgi:ATP-dependent phosphoenolpyruvate carboxykinase